jgi:hypothetical protein
MANTLTALEAARAAQESAIHIWYMARDADWTPEKAALVQAARDRCNAARIAENTAWLAHYRPDLLRCEVSA